MSLEDRVSENDPSAYNFTPTQDWFTSNIPAWTSYFPLITSAAPRVLEIGCWEGRSAVFLLNELCRTGGELVTIDHFDGMRTEAGRSRYAKVQHNLSLTGKPFRVIDDFSVPALMTLLKEQMMSSLPGFDWLYIDGSHEADDTFLDGELAWRLAEKGAVIVFDDYDWDVQPKESMHHPKRGIDAFMTLHQGEYEVLSSDTQYQMVLRKTCERRIGFLMKDVESTSRLEDALGYGINVAITVDAEYAMAAAVAIRSAVDATEGRISFYIVDCGLGERDQQCIRNSVPERHDLTLCFIPLPANSLAADPKLGPQWAKIDIISAMPVERVLYLDADVLIRKDLTPLWRLDLKGRPLGAVVDVGFPLGHAETPAGRVPYFNSGVMLMDLAQMRKSFQNLKDLALQMTNSMFPDQDALNAHFQSDWVQLGLEWNAQGLGTYASLPSPERATIHIEDMDDPGVVHFTGPVHPSMADILNPYVQPYTAKPWGYAGAPNHPFAEQWWNVAWKTAWASWIAEDGYKESCARERDKAVKQGVISFNGKLDIVGSTE